MSYRIKMIYAFCVIDPESGDEGIVTMHSKAGAMPLIGSDMERVDSLRPVVRDLVKQTGQKVRLLKFTNMELVEEFRTGDVH